jgi:hypothetical protein
VRKRGDNNGAFANILRAIWLRWKLSYSCEVCHSAKKLNGKPYLRS